MLAVDDVQSVLMALLMLVAGAPARAGRPVAVTPAVILAQTKGLRPKVLHLALTAYENARREGLVRRRVLTIIDFELPSYAKRLWVIDMASGKLLFEEWVAHGMGSPRGSGGTMEEAPGFSNESGSLMSSLGLYTTSDTYQGKHGYSLRLDGQEPGINDHARERLIVIHGAAYVTRERAERHMVGRSWGCPVLRPEITRALVDSVKGGSVVWAYYPDPHWLVAQELSCYIKSITTLSIVPVKRVSSPMPRPSATGV